MMDLLTIDVGTTNWKALLFNAEGEVTASAKIPTVISNDKWGLPCYSHELLWSSIVSCIKDINAAHGLARVGAVAVTSMAESVIPIDKGGEVLCDVIPWFDARSISELDVFHKEIGNDAVFDQTGLEIGAIFSLPKILWMRRHHPDIFDRAAKWLQMSDFINFKLTGKTVTDYSIACRTMAFDINTNTWSNSITKAVGVSTQVFPDVCASGTQIGIVTKEAAFATGLKQGTPVIMGGHDHPCATISANTFGSSAILDSSGTAEPFLFVSERGAELPEKRLGQRHGRHPDPERFIIWGGIVSSGISVEWAVKRLGLCNDWHFTAPDIPLNELFDMCKDLPCGSGGVIFTPFLRGSGAPEWDPRMKANFLGANHNTTSRHMLRAVLEGLSYQAKIIIEMQEALSGKTVDQIVCVGGGSRGRLWQQIKADVIGKPVVTRTVDEATGQGAAILAGVGIGLFKDMYEGAKAFAKEAQTYLPDTANHQAYQPIVDIYRDVHQTLQDINHRLDDFSKQNLSI